MSLPARRLVVSILAQEECVAPWLGEGGVFVVDMSSRRPPTAVSCCTVAKWARGRTVHSYTLSIAFLACTHLLSYQL